MSKIELRVLTPTVRATISPYKFSIEANMVIVRAITGDRGFLPGHETCSVVLDAGIMRIMTDEYEQELKLAVLGGIAQMEDNILTVITENAEWSEDIDRTRAALLRDDILAKLEKAPHHEAERLKRELREAEVLMSVSALPPSGITHEK